MRNQRGETFMFLRQENQIREFVNANKIPKERPKVVVDSNAAAAGLEFTDAEDIEYALLKGTRGIDGNSSASHERFELVGYFRRPLISPSRFNQRVQARHSLGLSAAVGPPSGCRRQGVLVPRG